MLSDLLIHPRTLAGLTQFIASPGHALVLCGADGIGKTILAQRLIAAILELDHRTLDRYPHFLLIQPDERGTISIEAIRGLQKFVQLKTAGQAAVRRAVIIEHADSLTSEAQNAFLKLLEEPPADTILVLTSASLHTLLPTIRSRVQSVVVHPPDQPSSLAYFASMGDSTAVNQAYFMSGGLPGLMHALLNQDEPHPLLASVQAAKELLQKKPFERLASIEALGKQRDQVINVICALERIAATALQGATAKQNTTAVAQWHRIRKATVEAQNALAVSANLKLVLTNLLITLP